MKVNKSMVLLVIFTLTMGILVGCSSQLPDGFENKTFFKDMENIYDSVFKSASERTYYKDDIDEILGKMDKTDYQRKLNDYELSIYELTKEVLVKVESDLTTGKKMIQSYTVDDMELIGKMLGY